MTVRRSTALLALVVLLLVMVPVVAAADVLGASDPPVVPPVTDEPTTDPTVPPTVEVPPVPEVPPVTVPEVPPVPPLTVLEVPPADDGMPMPSNPVSPASGPEDESVIETGYLEIVKVEKGGHAPDTPGTYTIAWDGPGDADGQVDVTAGTPAVVGPLPIGGYTLSELSPPAGAQVSIAPNPVTVTAGDASTAVRATVTNHFGGDGNHGFLQVVKVETGVNAPDTPGTYTIAWDGPGDADGQVDVTAGTPVFVGHLPFGDYTLSEVDPPEGATVTIAPNPVSITRSGRHWAALATVTNDYPLLTGYLAIDKVETGETAPDTPGTYTIAWDGPGDADGQVDVTAGTPAVVGPLPLGDYTLSEVDPPEGATVTIAPNPVTVTAGDAASAAEVTVTNSFPDVDPGGIVDPPVGPPEPDVASDSVTTGPGPLPRTGATTLPLLLAGVALVAVGALLTGGRRLLEHRTR